MSDARVSATDPAVIAAAVDRLKLNLAELPNGSPADQLLGLVRVGAVDLAVVLDAWDAARWTPDTEETP